MTRAMPGELANGDRWLVLESAQGLTVLVVDGLGHGEGAAAAADAAIEAVRNRSDLSPAQLMHACDRALRGTRGAAASALWLDGGRAIFAGIGNVEGRVALRGAAEDRRWSPDRGVLGRGIREPHPVEFALSGDWTTFLHTDGVSARFDASELAEGLNAEATAERVMASWARPTDDATVVVVQARS